MAAALVSFGHGTPAPWDWRVSGYTWTKSIAAGVLMVLGSAWVGGQEFARAWHIWSAVLAGLFTVLTGVLLVADLTHPKRFLYVLTRPQWRSWLARGAYLLFGYGIVAALYGLAAILDSPEALRVVRWPAIALAVPAAVYTAFILGQSKGRDLWQNDLLPVTFLAHAVLAGFAVLVVMEAPLNLSASGANVLHAGLLGAATVVACLLLSELTMSRPTRQAELAARNLLRGRYGTLFWAGAISVVAAAFSAGIAMVGDIAALAYVGAALALAGLFSYEHAYIQAGQSVPLAEDGGW
jgi:formate-dependent nitrite reductase membrane component NrfD